MRLALCLVILVLALPGCRSGRVERAAPGQSTMNELMHRRVAESRLRDAERKQFLEEARTLTPAQAAELDRASDAASHERLASYYEQRNDEPNRTRQVLWLIEHAPSPPMLYIDPAVDLPGFQRGKRLWLERSQRSDARPEIAVRAARFISSGDKPAAEKLLLEAQSRYPGSSAQFSALLGDMYGDALLGASGSKPLGVIRAVHKEDVTGTFARAVRSKLETTTDATLLRSAAGALLVEGQRLTHERLVDFDPIALGRKYAEGAIALAPDTDSARRLRHSTIAIENEQRLRTLLASRTLEQALASATTPEDKLLLLRSSMHRSFAANDLAKAETRGNELLRSAGAQRGDLLYQANIVLGKVALRRGNRGGAVRYLRAAGNVPSSAPLQYGAISMDLPRALIDWGERSAVADFLEACAERNYRGEQLRKWASEIRQGINPDLVPITTGCSQDPC